MVPRGGIELPTQGFSMGMNCCGLSLRNGRIWIVRTPQWYIFQTNPELFRELLKDSRQYQWVNRRSAGPWYALYLDRQNDSEQVGFLITAALPEAVSLINRDLRYLIFNEYITDIVNYYFTHFSEQRFLWKTQKKCRQCSLLKAI